MNINKILSIILMIVFVLFLVLVGMKNMPFPDKAEVSKMEYQLGTGIEKGEIETLAPYYYKAEELYQNDMILGLKDKKLEAEINEFIKTSKEKLTQKIPELEGYIQKSNQTAKNASGYEWMEYYVFNSENPITTEVTCRNGYLSIAVCLNYDIAVQAGKTMCYDAYTAVYDLYTGQRLQLSDLFFKGSDYNQFLYEEILPKVEIKRDLEVPIYTKRNFTGVPKNHNTFSLDKIYFTRNNPYFIDGEIFTMDYSSSEILVLNIPRDMENIFENDGVVKKELQRYFVVEEYKQEKKEGITISYPMIQLPNKEMENIINAKVADFVAEQDIDKIEEFMISKGITEKYGEEYLIDISFSSVYGKDYIFCEGFFGYYYMEYFVWAFDLNTGEWTDITEDWWEKEQAYIKMTEEKYGIIREEK